MKLHVKLSYCPKEKKPCVKWVEEYLKDCLCNLKDEISFGFGVASLVCWGVAEIPQLITNYRNKSGSGVSLAFLFTWIIGDIFNLVGCILEPATLPTQLYTAVLYTTTTVVLVLQCIYYDHFLQWWKCQKINLNQAEDESKPLKPKPHGSSEPTPIAPVEVPWRRDFYYMSARSLAGSATPPAYNSYIKARSGPSVLEHHTATDSSDDDDGDDQDHPLTQPRTIPSSALYGTFLATSANMLSRTKAALSEAHITGRISLQEHGDINAYGQWLGWLMAAIYMGGRLPQIWLNIKRGSVEGLNPLMFIFALIANATYVGSILVRSTEWEKIKANLPWLLDAIVCVGLDLFYVYYKYVTKRRFIEDQYFGDYDEAK